MIQFRQPNKEDWISTIIKVSLFIAVIVSGAVFLLPANGIVWLILVVAALILLVRWHSQNFGYRCLKCGHEFTISTATDLISPHGMGKSGGWKYLRCPQCRERSRASVLRIVKKTKENGK